MTKRARILTCGNCHGFDRLVAQLAELDIDVLGWAGVAELAGLSLASSDLDVVLYASGSDGSLSDDLRLIQSKGHRGKPQGDPPPYAAISVHLTK